VTFETLLWHFTPNDLADGTRVTKARIVTTEISTMVHGKISSIYVASAADVITLFGSLDVVPTAGSLQVISASMRAFRLQQ
jgi:hypothetical protein